MTEQTCYRLDHWLVEILPFPQFTTTLLLSVVCVDAISYADWNSSCINDQWRLH